MCGIIGFVGNEPAAPILLDGLERMEYRGYDSAGVAVRSETAGLQVRKTKGRLQVLSDLIHGGADLEGNLGIGHTRWATHGEPNDINAHPHVSENGRIALVHNGIIENYLEIKEHLMRQGVHFTSDTDTEVVAQLLEFHYNECHNMLEAVGRCLRRIEGSYAFGIICADYPNALIAARKDSPLIIGYGQNGNFIASDVTAVIKYTRDVVYMDDGEIAVLTADSVDVFDDELLPVEKTHSLVDWDVSAAEKGGYAHFMAKEIMEQPEAVRKTISPRIRDGRVVLDDLHLTAEYVRDLARWRWCWPPSSGTVILWWTKRLWSSSSASLEKPWTLWPPCGRPSAGAAGPWPSSMWWAAPSPGRRMTCCTLGPGRRSPWPPPRHTPPSWC